MTVDKQLKKKISQRWKIIVCSRSGFVSPEAASAFAQLEYILMEAGLLAKPRKKRHEFGKISPDSGIVAGKKCTSRNDPTTKAEGDPVPVHRVAPVDGEASEIDDNTMSLSEEVGRNYGE